MSQLDLNYDDYKSVIFESVAEYVNSPEKKQFIPAGKAGTFDACASSKNKQVHCSINNRAQKPTTLTQHKQYLSALKSHLSSVQQYNNQCKDDQQCKKDSLATFTKGLRKAILSGKENSVRNWTHKSDQLTNQTQDPQCSNSKQSCYKAHESRVQQVNEQLSTVTDTNNANIGQNSSQEANSLDRQGNSMTKQKAQDNKNQNKLGVPDSVSQQKQQGQPSSLRQRVKVEERLLNQQVQDCEGNILGEQQKVSQQQEQNIINRLYNGTFDPNAAARRDELASEVNEWITGLLQTGQNSSEDKQSANELMSDQDTQNQSQIADINAAESNQTQHCQQVENAQQNVIYNACDPTNADFKAQDEDDLDGLLNFVSDLDYDAYIERLQSVDDKELTEVIQDLKSQQPQENDSDQTRHEKQQKWRKTFVRAMNHITLKRAQLNQVDFKMRQKEGGSIADSQCSQFDRMTVTSSQRQADGLARRQRASAKMNEVDGWQGSQVDDDELRSRQQEQQNAKSAEFLLYEHPELKSTHSVKSASKLIDQECAKLQTIDEV